MTYSYDPFGVPGPRGRARAGAVVSRAEFQQLQQIAQELKHHLEQEMTRNNELQAALEQQAKELRHRVQEVEIKSEALRQQSEHQKQLETELMFTRSALAEQRVKLAENPEEASWQERYARLQAEIDSLRKRWEQRSVAETAENRRKILADMLPLADHLDLAMQHQPENDDAQVRNFVNNIEATRRAFLETLRRYGVERIDPLNEPFDPARHEALGQTLSDSVPADHVALVAQAGYAEGDRLLRPARVLVSSGLRTNVEEAANGS